MRQEFNFLFKALHASRFLSKVDLSEAGTIEIGCVVDPGLSQSRFGPGFDDSWPKVISVFIRKHSHAGRTQSDTDLPQGFSSVVFKEKILSKLYKLRTSSFSVSNSIQPLKFGSVS